MHLATGRQAAKTHTRFRADSQSSRGTQSTLQEGQAGGRAGGQAVRTHVQAAGYPAVACRPMVLHAAAQA